MSRMIIFVTSFAVLAAPCLLAQVPATGDTVGAAVQYKLANVVARVNGHVITDDLLYQRLFRLHGAQVLGQMISEMLVEDEARAQSIEIPEKDLDARFAEFTQGFATPADLENWLRQQGLRGEDVKAQLRLGMLQEGIVAHARGISVTPEEVAAFFEQNKERLGTPEHYRLRHILLASHAEADEALIALQAGADFAKLAALKSQDAATKDAGGDLGFLTLAALAPELQQALAELPVGGTSPVIPMEYGFHVIRLEEKKDSVPAEFDKRMKDELQKGLLKSKVDAAMPEFMRELHAKAAISLSGIAGSP